MNIIAVTLGVEPITLPEQIERYVPMHRMQPRPAMLQRAAEHCRNLAAEYDAVLLLDTSLKAPAWMLSKLIHAHAQLGLPVSPPIPILGGAMNAVKMPRKTDLYLTECGCVVFDPAVLPASFSLPKDSEYAADQGLSTLLGGVILLRLPVHRTIGGHLVRCTPDTLRRVPRLLESAETIVIGARRAKLGSPPPKPKPDSNPKR